MAFDSTVKGLWEFQQSLDDGVANNDISSSGLQVPFYSQFQRYNLIEDKIETRYGLKFEENKPYTAGSSISFVSGTYRLGLGFWWNSGGVVGFTRHAVTRSLQPKRAPLLAKADSTKADGFETVSNAEFIVSERGYSQTQNVIELALCTSGGMPTHTFISEPFTPSGLHHIFVTYREIDASNGYARIDIDGKLGTIHYAPGGLASQVGEFRLFDIGYDYTAHAAAHADGAFITDLIAKCSTSLDSTEAQKMYTYGWEYIALTENAFQDFTYFGIPYLQPTTVNTNQIYAEGDNIFVVRSDGKILKGFRPIWDREFTYTDENSLNFLRISKQDATRFAEWTSEGLKLTGVLVTV